MRKTSSRLADGRELIYFDDPDGSERPSRRPADRRDLAPTSTRSELRHDAVLDEWVTIASHRQGRTHLPPADECPLCPSRGGRATEIPADDYDVVVFENRFPSFAGTMHPAAGATEPSAELLVRRPGDGRCEVVCFTADHDASFAELTPTRVRTVIDAWADRTAALGELPGVEQVVPFENRGEEIGVTLRHPHGQVYGYPFVTPHTRRMLDAARRHRERTGRDLHADLLAAERASGERVVVAGERWTALVPFAARWPIEVRLYPHRKLADLTGLDDAERRELATVYLDLLRRLDALYDEQLPYVSAWHQAPVRVDRDLAYLHLQVFSIRRAPGKLKYLAGSESGAGAWINDVRPEEMAARLREVGHR